MVVYSFYIFDRHGEDNECLHHRPVLDPGTLTLIAECIYKRRWLPPSISTTGKTSRPSSQAYINGTTQRGTTLSAEDDAKLIFGAVFSLRNMVRKLGGEDDRSVDDTFAFGTVPETS